MRFVPLFLLCITLLYVFSIPSPLTSTLIKVEVDVEEETENHRHENHHSGNHQHHDSSSTTTPAHPLHHLFPHFESHYNIPALAFHHDIIHIDHAAISSALSSLSSLPDITSSQYYSLLTPDVNPNDDTLATLECTGGIFATGNQLKETKPDIVAKKMGNKWGKCQGNLFGHTFDGNCLPVLACAQGTPIPGHCPGDKNIQCCLSKLDHVDILPGSDSDWQTKFVLWAKTQGRKYTFSEYKRRFDLFQKNAQNIHQHNMDKDNGTKKSTYTLSLTERSDKEGSELYMSREKLMSGAMYNLKELEEGKDNHLDNNKYLEKKKAQSKRHGASASSAISSSSSTPVIHHGAKPTPKPSPHPTPKPPQPLFYDRPGVPRCHIPHMKNDGYCIADYQECKAGGGESGGWDPCAKQAKADGVDHYFCCEKGEDLDQLINHPYYEPWIPAPVIDWRTTATYTTKVKDQGVCGSCYDFSSTAVLETRWAIHTEQPAVPLSTQQFLSCSGKQKPCDGGWESEVFSWGYHSGVCSEKEFPYIFGNVISSRGAVGMAVVTNVTIDAQALCHSCTPVLPPWYDSNKPSLQGAVGVQGEKNIEKALKHGPLVFNMPVPADFGNFAEGIYDPSHDCASKDGHSMAIWGYGFDSHYNSSYWIVRNSWGTAFGEEGYGRLVKGKNACGVENTMSYPWFHEQSVD